MDFFDCDSSPDCGIARFVNDPHGAPAQLFEDLVAAYVIHES
jgi:hypothetical protein